MTTPQGIKAVVLGGGTGTFTVLSGLKHYVNAITAVVNMVDDGGSTGVLRDELGVLPPGDVRQCLVALSSSPEIVRELFNYRFPQGAFGGHSFGNLFLTALEKITGSFSEAVHTAEEILHIQGKVIPVTTDNVHLCLKLKNGTVIEGQNSVDQSFFDVGDKPELFLKPAAKLNRHADTALRTADVIVLGPGNMYSSLVPTLMVDGVADALRESKAKKMYVCNLVTKPGQTDGFFVHDFVNEIERYIGENVLDYVVYNTKKPHKELLEKYAREGEYAVEFDSEVMQGKFYRAAGAELLADGIYQQNPDDTLLHRTLIRHDSEKLARLLFKLYFS